MHHFNSVLSLRITICKSQFANHNLYIGAYWHTLITKWTLWSDHIGSCCVILWYIIAIYILGVHVCVHSYCWISMCTSFNYNTSSYPESSRLWYSAMCMLVRSTQYLYYTHWHISTWGVSCHYTCILCSTYRMVHSTGLVVMVILLELKNCCRWVRTSTIMNKWVIVRTLHTSGCVGYQYTVLIQPQWDHHYRPISMWITAF